MGLFNGPALRVCADIEILVPTENLADAFHLIVSFGYQSEFTHRSLLLQSPDLKTVALNAHRFAAGSENSPRHSTFIPEHFREVTEPRP
jgi:hypothetical protein